MFPTCEQRASFKPFVHLSVRKSRSDLAMKLVEAEAASVLELLNNELRELREQIWKQQEVVSGFLLRLTLSNVV